jgi:dolichol-phosphate mannosyltransferase
MKDVVVLPTYNESTNVATLVREIFSLVPTIHILVVDDNSPDGTAGEVRRLQKEFPQLSLLERPGKQGLGEAYKDALSRLSQDQDIRAIVTMDADGSHGPQYLIPMLAQIKDYDLVVGSRYIRGGGVSGWERWRLMLSSGGNIYSRLLTGLPVHDLTAGFVAFRRSLVERMDFSQIGSAGYAYQIEFKFYAINRLRARVTEVPIIFFQRRGGESKISNQIVVEGLKTPLKIFWRRLRSWLQP